MSVFRADSHEAIALRGKPPAEAAVALTGPPVTFSDWVFIYSAGSVEAGVTIKPASGYGNSCNAYISLKSGTGEFSESVFEIRKAPESLNFTLYTVMKVDNTKGGTVTAFATWSVSSEGETRSQVITHKIAAW